MTVVSRASAAPKPRDRRFDRRFVSRLALAAALGLPLAACSATRVTTHHGYIFSEDALSQVSVGSSREQVLVVLGSPSTTATLDNEVFYYISQRVERPMPFMTPRIVDQQVVAIYFNSNHRVERIARYGLQDGRIFDFVSRTTPTGGRDLSFLRQIFEGVGRVNPLGGS